MWLLLASDSSNQNATETERKKCTTTTTSTSDRKRTEAIADGPSLKSCGAHSLLFIGDDRIQPLNDGC